MQDDPNSAITAYANSLAQVLPPDVARQTAERHILAHRKVNAGPGAQDAKIDGGALSDLLRYLRARGVILLDLIGDEGRPADVATEYGAAVADAVRGNVFHLDTVPISEAERQALRRAVDDGNTRY